MTGRRKQTVRNFFFRIHAWLGLHLCIALGIIFFTGTLLMFSPELTNISQPSLWITAGQSEEKVSVGRIYDRVLKTSSPQRINSIGSQPRMWFGRPVYTSTNNRSLVAHVNPYSGELLGFQHRGKLSLRNIVRKMHDSLLVPVNLANVLVNSLSFAVMALVVTGLIAYRRFWKGWFLKIPRSANRRVRAGAKHRKFGIWVAPFLIVSTMASAVFFFNAIGFKAVNKGAPVSQQARSSGLPENFNGDALDRLVSSCQKEMSDFIEAGVKFPTSGKQYVHINGYQNNVGSIFGNASCHVDPESGEVAGIIRASDGNTMTQIKSLAIAVHFGSFAGWLSIVLWMIFGACSTYLAFIGAKVYAAKRIVKTGGYQSVLRGRSTLSLVVEGLGVFKWLYVLWILAAIALMIRDII